MSFLLLFLLRFLLLSSLLILRRPCCPPARVFSAVSAALCACDLFVYCGHGAGERVVRRERVEALAAVPGVILLMGCSSGQLHTGVLRGGNH